jgi:5'-nucleotidase
MSKPLTILVDMDSILADFYFGVLDAYERETGDKPHPNVLNAWDAKFPNGKDCFPYFSVPGFFRGLKPVSGAIPFIHKARELGHEVVICSTGTLTHVPGEKFEWLTEHVPELDRVKHVVFTGRKDLVRGDVLIDDHAKNTTAWKAAHPSGLTIGIQYPYNVNDWGAFDHLFASHMDFNFAWFQIGRVVFNEFDKV